MKNPPSLSALIILMSLILSVNSYGQENTNAPKSTAEKEAIQREEFNSALGTFQFQIVNSRIKPSMHANVIELIEENRAENEIVYVKFSDEIRIKILPKSMIAGNFEKLETFEYVQD